MTMTMSALLSKAHLQHASNSYSQRSPGAIPQALSYLFPSFTNSLLACNHDTLLNVQLIYNIVQIPNAFWGWVLIWQQSITVLVCLLCQNSVIGVNNQRDVCVHNITQTMIMH